MADTALPVSVNIATYNEEKNIVACLTSVKKNNPFEIIVIDAGSGDNTRYLAQSLGAKVVTVEKRGLAFQRSRGLELSGQPFIALVDAHDRLAPDCFSLLLKDIAQNGYDAVQAELGVARKKTYWERAYDFNARLSISIPGKTNMVGRPCIYKSPAIRKVGFDDFFGFGIGCEDTDVSIRFEELNFSQGKGRGKAWRLMPSSLSIWMGKWKKYGRGDARIIAKYPHKRAAIRKHQLYGYPIQRSLRALRAGGGVYIPFFILFGILRFFWSLKEKHTLSHLDQV